MTISGLKKVGVETLPSSQKVSESSVSESPRVNVVPSSFKAQVMFGTRAASFNSAAVGAVRSAKASGRARQNVTFVRYILVLAISSLPQYRYWFRSRLSSHSCHSFLNQRKTCLGVPQLFLP